MKSNIFWNIFNYINVFYNKQNVLTPKLMQRKWSLKVQTIHAQKEEIAPGVSANHTNLVHILEISSYLTAYKEVMIVYWINTTFLLLNKYIFI